MVRIISFFILHWFVTWSGMAQYSYNLPVLDIPQNLESPHLYPSMYQSLQWSQDLYNLSFHGIDKLGKLAIRDGEKKWKRDGFNYVVGLAFSKYASELPIPLGIWAHEEYHRSVLGVYNISSKNGNWIFHRWDGTVYGPSDTELANLKSENLNGLLYSYVAGMQYETQLTQSHQVDAFVSNQNGFAPPLYLYNAYYAWNYFHFSTSEASNKVKNIAPEFESKNPSERDFAGADLTAWVYDMFSPDSSYLSRDLFPGGDGVNRRIGFSDLTEDGQEFLIRQRNLALLNFLNPAIFLVKEIRLGNEVEVLPFAQYQPTYFGNTLSFNLPIRTANNSFFVGIQNFNNHSLHRIGIELGLYQQEFRFVSGLKTDLFLNLWDQPTHYFSTGSRAGGSAQVTLSYPMSSKWLVYIQTGWKSAGWLEGNPYLDQKMNALVGLKFNAFKSS